MIMMILMNKKTIEGTYKSWLTLRLWWEYLYQNTREGTCKSWITRKASEGISKPKIASNISEEYLNPKLIAIL